MRPRVLIVADVPGWALDRTARNVSARLSDRFDFELVYNKNAVQKIREGRYDLLYITYWRQFQDAGISIELPSCCISGVRSHFKWDGGRGLPPSPEVLNKLRSYQALNVPSRLLFQIFHDKHPAVFYTPHGVDTAVFKPARSGGGSPGGRLVLGWAGSKSNHPGKRGIEDYLLPAVEGLAGVELRFAAREERWRTQEEMVDFYCGLDAYICASRSEGGPHPLLEASACGLPIISTAVGIAPELLAGGKNGILTERTVEAIREAVVRLRDDRELRLSMGRCARQTAERFWNWDIQAEHYVPFFNEALSSSELRSR